MIGVGADVSVPGGLASGGGGVITMDDDWCDGAVDGGDFNGSNVFGDVVASDGVIVNGNFGVVFFDIGDIIIDGGCCDSVGSGVVNFGCDFVIDDPDHCDDGNGVTGDICGSGAVDVVATLPPPPLDGLPPSPSPPARKPTGSAQICSISGDVVGASSTNISFSVGLHGHFVWSICCIVQVPELPASFVMEEGAGRSFTWPTSCFSTVESVSSTFSKVTALSFLLLLEGLLETSSSSTLTSLLWSLSSLSSSILLLPRFFCPWTLSPLLTATSERLLAPNSFLEFSSVTESSASMMRVASVTCLFRAVLWLEMILVLQSLSTISPSCDSFEWSHIADLASPFSGQPSFWPLNSLKCSFNLSYGDLDVSPRYRILLPALSHILQVML